MEEGEIIDPKPEIQEPEYDPSMEWPGDGSDMPSTSSSALYTVVDEASASEKLVLTSNSVTPRSSTLRLIVRRSLVLPGTQILAIIDGYSEVQIGRDAPSAGYSIPRLRLKEMEVSKLHATIFWDKSREQWAIVDMGSKHGTFHQPVRSLSGGTIPTPSVDGPHASAPPSSKPAALGTRLSPPRVASIPRSLAHGDHLSIGGTVFTVHVHPFGMPCADCSPRGGDEIPLLHQPPSVKRNRAVADPTPAKLNLSTSRDAKKAMTMLKHSLLSSRDPFASSSSSISPATPYVDRSARRRALHSETFDPEILPLAKNSTFTASSSVSPNSALAAATPLPSTNIGHRLLIKQGWQPGSALGVSNSAEAHHDSVVLTEPLNVSGNSTRTGLGMPVTVPNRPDSSADGPDWKEDAKLRRWASVRVPKDV